VGDPSAECREPQPGEGTGQVAEAHRACRRRSRSRPPHRSHGSAL
jgi:hypothetical protein